MGSNGKKILVCGGAGFIGSHFVDLAVERGCSVVVLDLLTYAGHEANLEKAKDAGYVELVIGDICDVELVSSLFEKHSFSNVVNFAAESHVDRSISGPGVFVNTNIVGTFNLLRHSLAYFEKLNDSQKNDFRYLQISTDEVFGELGETDKFTEETPYSPRSPYSASKASGDHLVRAWHATYGLPTLITNCSNNYGPRQFPEKLIPVIIQNAIGGKKLPVYGAGANIRDWIHVEDHCKGVWLALNDGTPGETYCFGGDSERRNIDVVEKICMILDQIKPKESGDSYKSQITFVNDRLGHDFRYAIDDTKAMEKLNFKRDFEQFEQGLEATIQWYLANQEWCQKVVAG